MSYSSKVDKLFNKTMQNRARIILTILAFALLPSAAFAQNLDSTNFTLVEPSLGGPLSGAVESTNYKQLFDSTVGSYTTFSSLFQLRGGTSTFTEAAVPEVSCFETDTDSGSTNCTGLPGADGMSALCSSLGCFDAAKIEIDPNTNPDDTQYAIEVSTTSDFSAELYLVNPITRFLDAGATLDETYFIPKCEWEGTVVSGICPSANTTYQGTNILGLTPGTTYYLRVSAHHGNPSDPEFIHSGFGPSESATTAFPTISIDIDIAPDTVTPSSPPNVLDSGTLQPGAINTAADLIILKLTSNATNGIETQLRGLNGELDHVSLSDFIDSINGDLDAASSGYGLRNVDTTNSADNTGTIGSINVSATPSDFTDTGADTKVGEVPVTPVNLFNSGGSPIDNGITGYEVMVKPLTSNAPGDYQEIITFYVYASF